MGNDESTQSLWQQVVDKVRTRPALWKGRGPIILLLVKLTPRPDTCLNACRIDFMLHRFSHEISPTTSIVSSANYRIENEIVSQTG